MVINNAYNTGERNIGQLFYQLMLDTICKDRAKCKMKDDLKKGSESTLKMTISENLNNNRKDDHDNQVTIEYKQADFFKIHRDQEIYFNIQEYWDESTQLNNVPI